MPGTRVFAFVLLAVAIASAQRSSRFAAPDHPVQQPRVIFTQEFAGVEPEHYEIKLSLGGSLEYKSLKKLQAPDQEPFTRTASVSGSLAGRVFELARAADYFKSDVDFRKHRIAFTGKKMLGYEAGHTRSETTYNWSESPAVQELTDIFFALSRTIESGEKLLLLRRFDKLGLERELKDLEQAVKDRRALEMGMIAPALQKIAADPQVMNVARARAEKLLKTDDAKSAEAAPDPAGSRWNAGSLER